MSRIAYAIVSVTFALSFAFTSIRFAAMSSENFVDRSACLLYSAFFAFLLFMVGVIIGFFHL